MKKNNEDFLHYYLGCEMICHKDFRPNHKEYHPNGIGFCYLTADLLSDIHAKRLEYGTPHFKLLLRPFEAITEDEWAKAWLVIGGTPHLYTFGLDDLKEALKSGEWDASGVTMDYFTMSQLINYFRKIGIDCDDLLPCEKAVNKLTYKNK